MHTNVSSDLVTFVPWPPGFCSISVLSHRWSSGLTPVSISFHRWLAAEGDVVDASRLLQFLVREDCNAHAAKQQAVVIELKCVADALLREYFYLLQCEDYQFPPANLSPEQ